MYQFHGVARIYFRNGGFFVKIPKDDELTTEEAIQAYHYDKAKADRKNARKQKYLAKRKKLAAGAQP